MLVGMRIVTLDKTVAMSLLLAERVTENVKLKNLFSLMLSISSIVHIASLVCRSLQTWRPMWSICALVLHWPCASRAKML